MFVSCTGVVGHVVYAVCDVSESLRAVIHTVECCHVSCRERRRRERGGRGGKEGNKRVKFVGRK
jgi:hypothetical protein